MSNELTLSGTIQYADSQSADEALSIAQIYADVGTKKYIKAKQSIGTTEEAIVLGEVTAPGWAIFINRDTTNYLELRVATGGAKFAKLLHGEFTAVRLGSGAQVPFAIANNAACIMEYLIVNT